MPTPIRLFFFMLLATSGGLFAQSGIEPAPRGEAGRPLGLPAGHRRLSETELSALKQTRDELMLQLIAERNALRADSARRTAAEKAELRATLRDAQARSLKAMAEIEEQIRTGIRTERKP